MLLSTAQEWNLKLTSCKIWSGLIYNPRNSWQDPTGNAASVVPHCQRVSYLFLPCLGQDVFISCTLSYTAPDEIKAADNPDASSNNFFFVCFCLLICFFFFVPFIQRVKWRISMSYLPFLHDNTNHWAGLSSDTFPSKIYFRYENSWWEGEK